MDADNVKKLHPQDTEEILEVDSRFTIHDSRHLGTAKTRSPPRNSRIEWLNARVQLRTSAQRECVGWNALLDDFNIFERFSMTILPGGQSVRMPTVNDGSCGAWTPKLDISCEDKAVILDDEDPIVFELLPKITGPRPLFRRWAFISDRF